MNAFWKFVLVGGVSAGLNAVSRLGLSRLFSLEIAVALAYAIGMICAYTLSRMFVFQDSGRRVGAEFFRFAIVNGFSFLIVLGVTVLLARFVFPAIGFRWHSETIAHLIGVAAPVFASYLGHKYFTFERKVGQAS